MEQFKRTVQLFFSLLGVTVLIVITTLLLGLIFNFIRMALRYIVIDLLPFVDSYPYWLGIIISTVIILFVISAVFIYFDIKKTFK